MSNLFLRIPSHLLLALLLLLLQFLLYLIQSLQGQFVLLREVVHVEAGGVPDAPGEPEEQSKSMQVIEVEQRNRADMIANKPEEVVEHKCDVLVSLAEVADNSSAPGYAVGVEPHVVVLALPYSLAGDHEVHCVVEEGPAAVVSDWEQELFLEVKLEVEGDEAPLRLRKLRLLRQRVPSKTPNDQIWQHMERQGAQVIQIVKYHLIPKCSY